MPTPSRAPTGGVLVLDAEPVFAAGAGAVLAAAGLQVVAGDPATLPPADGGQAGAPDPGPPPGDAGAGPAGERPGRPAVGVVLLDSGLARAPQLAALVGRVATGFPGAKVVLVLRHRRQEGLLGLLDSGVRALLHRRCTPQELVAAVRAAGAGQTWVSAELAGAVRAQSRAERAGRLPDVLSARELEVLGQMAAGAPNAAIGRSLGISPNTVRNHVHAVLTKLGAANRTDAVARAVGMGIIEMPE